ncbi:Protein piccolo [Colletotrichum sp. SAR 10_76]|nr:Protein piccolo [Colletotrichum sp. SAR 10_76]
MSDLNKLVPDPTKRYNPLIKPTDAAWKEVEYTFRRMLDRPTLTIKQVLDDHFTPHERKLFLPAVEPRSLRECQEDSTRRYRALLAGRFKGHFPSLATKFAMLYFGLPVEPALSQFAQLSKPSFEIDDWGQLHEAEVSPPLHFLTAHDRRNFGYDHLRGKEAPYSTIPVPAARFRGHSSVTGVAQDDSESQGLNLRGGASAYSGYGDPTPRSPAKNLAELFGFQGRVTFDAANLSTLEQASRKLLSLKQRDQSDMVLDHMNRKDKSVVRSFNTKIPLPSTGDLANYVNEQTKTNQDCVWFVRRQGETTPTHWAPTDSDYTNHMVRLSRTNDFGGSDFAYYAVPRRGVFFGAESQSHTLPSTFPWGANQYMPFLTTAQEVLIGRPQIPGGSHCDIVLSGEHDFQKSYQNHWYGGLEIDYYFWLAMHPHVIRRTPTNITSEALPEDSIVFYLPGSRLNASTRELRKCSHKAGAKDPYEDALRTMENLMRVSHMPVKASQYRIWRGTDFFSHIIYPTRAERKPAEWHHLDQTARQQDQQNLSRFITDSVSDEREPCRLFVIQPVDGDVTCRMVSQEWNNGHQDFNVDSHAMATFKSKVRKLYEGCPNIDYDPEKHSILLQPLIPRKFANDWNPAPFILRPNDPDNQLAMIRRRIIAEEVQISILQDDKLDFVKQLDRSEWGPRYGDVTRFRDELGLPLISLARENFPHPPDERPEQRVPEENAREKTWSKQPSVFDRGIYNPSIPINAPPIEAIMRTGGSDTNLYLFNKNVLTATEQRDLQELGWKYRNMILDRQNGCPFEKCKYDYRQGKDVEFVQHLKESHVDNKCPWCDVQLFTHWTSQQREEHIKEKHAAQLRKILNMPDPRSVTRKPTVAQSTSEDLCAIPSTILGRLQPPKGPLPKLSPPPKANGKESEYRYCDRCGRDHHVLNDRDERDHHDRTCVPHAEAVGRCTFCETCGDAVWNNKEVRDEFAPYDEYPHRCRGTSHSKKPFCNKCGFSLRKLSDEKIDRHRQHCGGFFAHVGCFCPYCQKNFVVDGKQEEIETIKKHIIDCPDKKPPNITPFEIYPEGYWKDRDQPTDPLYIGSNATRDLVRRQPRRPAPNRFLSYPLAWHDKPGPSPVQDPPAECTIRGCLEPLFGLTPSEVLVHYETKHGGMPLKQCPLCRLDFRVPEEERKANENLPEIQARIFQVRHMECHVYELWKILEDKDIPHIPQREPFGPGHSMWDPDNERAVDRRDKRCPYFERCGAMVGFMNQRQLNHHMETAHGAEDFVIAKPRPPTRPKPVGPVPVPRNDVPTSGFVPDDDMYCSRCFRKAPKRGPRGIKRGDPDRQAQVDAHSDPNRSCRIPAKEGMFEVDEEDWPILPSRVGWIKQPKQVRLSKLKADFLDEHPELAKTMCPTDGSKRTNLTWQHDPNHNDNKGNWRLPFPGDDEDDEDDEDEDEDGVNADADGNFINDEEDDDEDEEYYEEVEDADGNKTIRRKTRGVRSMGLPRDETWKDTGEEDDLSVADSSELVPETASGDEAPSNTGDKRKRDETDAQGRAGSTKKTRVAEDEDELGDA